VNSSAFKISIGFLMSLCINLGYAAEPKAAQPTEPVVKKSDSGICHDKTSASFSSTKKFTEFKTMDECLKSGGRAPNGQTGADAMVKKSESGICHDKTSASYERTKKFTEFKTMDECVKSGGTAPKK
jgi:hypothetical protein